MVPLRPVLGRRRPLRAGAASALVLVIAAGALADRAASLELVYAPAAGANAIHDAGVTSALRQGPIFDDPRWPRSRQLAKVSGAGLSKMTAAGMEAALRAGLRDQRYGGRVGVDEIRPADWTPQSFLRLRDALRGLGSDADRVFIYISAAALEQVGRTAPSEPLPPSVNGIFAPLSEGGRAFLEVYRGSLEPLPLQIMAVSLTRWEARTPAARRGAVHALIGPSAGASQQEIWNRVRSTPAGRRILANGPGAFAHRTAQEGRDWVAAYRAFQADPTASPPGGDHPVPTGGGLTSPLAPGTTLAPGSSFRIAVDRPGRAVVRLVPRSGPARVIRALTFRGAGAASISLPRDIRPGAYSIVVTFNDVGVGLNERLVIPLTVRRRTGGGDTLASQLLINQRISQAAVRRLNAIQRWLDAGLVTGDLAGGGFGPGAFGPGVSLASGAGAPPEPAAPRPLAVASGSRGSAADVRAPPAQLLINQRISQAAVLRANGLKARLSGRLTGGDIVDGSLTAGKLAPGIVVAGTSADERPAPSVTRVGTPRRARGARVELGRRQLLINQRISQAAVRRANELRAQIGSGLAEANFRPGSITSHALDPALR